MKHIADTGVRGYLKWLQSDQPNLYRAVAPVIAQRVPGAFSDHEQSLAQGALMGLAQDEAASTPFYAGITPYSGDSSTWDFPSGSSGGASTAAPDVSDAANSGAASSDVVAAIQGIVNGYAQVKLQQAQLQAYQNLNATQLTRVAAGLSPLTTSSNSLGIPVISGVSGQTLTAGGAGLAVAAIVGLLILLGRRA